ncbi:GNAT family N-acetyltransferase [Algicella marina]|uniref:GNAT family N-acetyltransferase n=2 Tax=Algicella marina TaxID=2683284 RepID=A0A6P1T3G4_9RHOB|nr:GNAT family N-acetyltransferase [Algicella marina]
MAAILNEIIAIGGTTAFEDERSEAEVADIVMERPESLFAHVALDGEGAVAGFQYVIATDEAGVGSVATFARQAPVIRAVGTALLRATVLSSQAAGLTAIDAHIRGDNVPGLAYYSKMGFKDHAVVPSVPLKNGTPIDRIVKRLQL